MPSFAIIGAGQAGSMLAFALKNISPINAVSLFSNRTAEQILKGRITSSQGMFDSALQLERKLKLNYWDDQCPWNASVSFTLAVPGKAQKGIFWKGNTNKPYQSIDQRVKFAYWQEAYKKIGGNLYIQEVDSKELNSISKEHDLTIVATGKGEISQLFTRDEKRSLFHKPMRTLACLYVENVIPIKDSPGVRANIIPGVGEFFIMPGLTLDNKHCEMMLFEGIPGNAFDCWDNITNVEEQLEIAKKLLRQFIPWEYERCKEAKLTDNQATLLGRYTPTIKTPIAKMPNGKSIFGIADTVILNDPIAGQGANTAAKCTDILIKRIIEHGSKPFDENWMRNTFEEQWISHAQAATQWSNMLLLPPSPHIIDLFGAAAKYPEIANKLANGFDNPNTLFPWINDPSHTAIKNVEKKQIITASYYNMRI